MARNTEYSVAEKVLALVCLTGILLGVFVSAGYWVFAIVGGAGFAIAERTRRAQLGKSKTACASAGRAHAHTSTSVAFACLALVGTGLCCVCLCAGLLNLGDLDGGNRLGHVHESKKNNTVPNGFVAESVKQISYARTVCVGERRQTKSDTGLRWSEKKTRLWIDFHDRDWIRANLGSFSGFGEGPKFDNGMKHLEKEGRIFVLKVGEEVRVLGHHPGSRNEDWDDQFKVEVLTGEHKGKVGWLSYFGIDKGI